MRSSYLISNNNFDFAEMLSEMLGELNASHTGCRYYAGGAILFVPPSSRCLLRS